MKAFSKEGLAEPMDQRLVQLYDAFEFTKYCVFTKDERDTTMPVKPAPVWPKHPHYKWYIKPCMNILQSCTKDKIVFDKTRRMWISYTVLTFLLHHAFTHTDQRIGITTENATKSQEHLNNIAFIYENIPEEIWPAELRPTMRTKEGFIYFDEVGSVIHGLASGADQARQFGFSILFFDEMDFWEEQELTWAAAVPTTDRIIIASTHKMQETGEDSFYKRIINDQISAF